ncbi:MAG: acyl-ACP--UDP-N-acetylglucosamine O-acyltransferase [Verrucomicrobia bacterium]|nr:acyl-ACP--UDP-N-acetylglucosamine O-acyltransferase [Verrucomicrobiota bacterium]
MAPKTLIHATAVIDPAAELDEGVEVGPYAVIGPHVCIGAGTKIYPHAVIDGRTTIGARCEIFPGATIGLRCQDLKFRGEKTSVRIGDETTIRECVTINSSTGEGSATVVGSRCLLMAYCHVAHNCTLGDDVIMANVASLAGHITIEDKAILSGLAGVHQFVRIGTMSMTGGASKVNQDVPPYALSDGNPCRVRGVNAIGLKRRGVVQETREALHHAFKVLFFDGHPMTRAIELLDAEGPHAPEVAHLIEFCRASERGIGH